MKPADLNDQIVEVFHRTTQAERASIAKSWTDSYAADLSDYVTRTGLPPIALIVASLIDVDHPLLVSDRGVMYSATACALIVLGLEVNQFSIGSNEAIAMIARLTRKLRAVESSGKVPVPAVDNSVERAGKSSLLSTKKAGHAQINVRSPQTG